MLNEQRRQWWDKKYGKDNICPITRNRLRSGKNKQGQHRTVFLKCKHGFNRRALQEWVISSHECRCPLCRVTFNPIIVFEAEY